LIHGNTDIGGTTVLPLPEQIEGANTPQGNAASESTVSSHKPIYTIDELVVLHGFSRRTVIRLYEREPGVQVLERPEALFGRRSRKGKPGKRRYRTIRVPQAVYQRMKHRLEVHTRLQ
jgi:hypothetical protein